MLRWIGLLMLLATPALAHDSDHPERNGWFMTLNNAAGVHCCSITDSNVIKDVQWDVYRDPDGAAHYKIFIEDQWLSVPDANVVREPNRYGVPLAWMYHANGVPEVRCFLPGSGL